MQVTDNQKVIKTISRFDLAGGMNLYDVIPSWKDSKFVAYPYFLKQVPLCPGRMNFRDLQFVLYGLSDYNRIKGVYRLIYLSDKCNKDERETVYFRSYN